ELKWFFNKQRGACKSFWYGGCDVKARNFFGDIKSCRKTCGHKFAVSEEALKPHYIMSPPSDLHASPASTLPSPTSSYPEDISLFPPELEPTAFMMTQAASESTTGFVRNVDTAPHTYPKETTEESTNVSPTKTTLFINSAMDGTILALHSLLKVQTKVGDKRHLTLNIDANSIANKYCEGKLQRTLKREFKRTSLRLKWIGVLECQRACAHKMETSITPSGTSDRLREKMTSSVTLSSTVPNLSMSQIAADNPLALASTTQSSTFALVYPRKVVDFAKPLNVTGSSAKPWLTLRVKATLVTRRVIKANSEPPTVFSTVTASSIASTVPNSASTASSTAITSSTTASSAVVTTSSHTNVTRSTRAVALALNDAPEANELVFRSDLNQHLANEKRRLENRADLAYSSLVNHPVTVACMFLPFLLLVLSG
ncbi:unnamed protein product, partial [Heligmosomoides polygyrus]|uniref:BPTI/Kunitz inhibitor domain-containing protein n=1 Tax=Heligmosomoides polygyrus TaxID=6339 RepID=A0A183GN46_HELPZ